MAINSPRRWPLFIGLAAIIILTGGTMWLTQRARDKGVAAATLASATAAPVAAARPVLDLAAPAQVETATFSMG